MEFELSDRLPVSGPPPTSGHRKRDASGTEPLKHRGIQLQLLLSQYVGACTSNQPPLGRVHEGRHVKLICNATMHVSPLPYKRRLPAAGALKNLDLLLHLPGPASDRRYGLSQRPVFGRRPENHGVQFQPAISAQFQPALAEGEQRYSRLLRKRLASTSCR